MGSYRNGKSYKEDPIITIKIRDTDGKQKECSMNATDITPESKSYKCKAISDQDNIMKLDALSFKVEDKTEPNTGKPDRVKNFLPVTCAQHWTDYTCTKELAVMIGR